MPAVPTQPSPEVAIERGDVLLAVGDGRFLSRPIDGPELVIGRDPACDFAIDHPSLSRRHACFRIGASASIQDLGSTNGTRLDGAVLRGGPPVALTGQGSFQIGPFSFVVVARRPATLRSLSGSQQLRIVDPTPAGLPDIAREFARTSANILITGETGTGKEILATSLHAASGRTGSLIQINCAALSESLLENELFGHERGAFTGAVARSPGLIEAAAGGTLLLDEIGEMPLAVQAKLLRVIEQREVVRVGGTRPIAVDVRFLAATHRDLRADVAQHRFREDLYFRLDGVTLELAPLRERPGMIVPLALGFLARARSGAAVPLDADAVAALEDHRWPGNVRELKAVVERAAVLARSGPIGARHLMLDRAAPIAAGSGSMPAVAPGSPSSSPALAPVAIAAAPVTPASSSPALAPVEAAPAPAPALGPAEDDDRDRIIKALEQCAGNQSRAAKLLGISRTTMITKLRIYKIPRPMSRSD